MAGAKCHKHSHSTSQMEMSPRFFRVHMSNGMSDLVSECVCVTPVHLCVFSSSLRSVCRFISSEKLDTLSC